MLGFKTLLYLFFVYSIFGWVWETIYESIRNKRFLNRGFLNGFYIPIYGVAGIIMTFSLKSFQGELNFKNIACTYVAGLVIATTLEYFTSFLLEKLTGARWWDYTDYPLNIHGRICLIASLFWGVISVVFIDIIVPFLVKKEGEINHDLELIVLSSLSTIFILDLVVTIDSMIHLKQKMKTIVEEINVKELANNMKENVLSYKQKFYDSGNPFVKRIVMSFPKIKFKSDKMQKAFSLLQIGTNKKMKKQYHVKKEQEKELGNEE